MKKILLHEDWLSFIMGFLLIGAVLSGLSFTPPTFKWSSVDDLPVILGVQNGVAVGWLLLLLVVAACSMVFMGIHPVRRIVVGVVFLFLVSLLAQLLSGYEPINRLGIEYVIFALLLGIA